VSCRCRRRRWWQWTYQWRCPPPPPPLVAGGGGAGLRPSWGCCSHHHQHNYTQHSCSRHGRRSSSSGSSSGSMNQWGTWRHFSPPPIRARVRSSVSTAWGSRPAVDPQRRVPRGDSWRVRGAVGRWAALPSLFSGPRDRGRGARGPEYAQGAAQQRRCPVIKPPPVPKNGFCPTRGDQTPVFNAARQNTKPTLKAAESSCCPKAPPARTEPGYQGQEHLCVFLLLAFVHLALLLRLLLLLSPRDSIVLHVQQHTGQVRRSITGTHDRFPCTYL
jgi:hypothetical protein